ncbi:MAG: insulinase family protein [Chitinophagaceae bacterium]
MIKYIFGALIFSMQLVPAFSQTINRTKPPAPQPAPVIKINDPQTFTLSNGIKVLVVENHKAPKVTITYTIDRTPILEGNKAGVIGLLGQMMNEGTKSRTKAVFDEEVDLIGASVNVYSSGGSVNTLTKYVEKAVALMSDALRNPSFSAASLEKLRQQSIQGLKSEEKNATTISNRVVQALTFGPTHPYGEFETEASYKNITLDDIKNAYAKYVTSDRSYLIFVGDINLARAKTIATRYFADWKGNKLTMSTPALPGKQATSELDVVDVPSAVQTVIKVTQPIDFRLNSPDYFPVLLANEILGGGADSRLYKNLREKRGYTYGAYSSASNDRFGSGLFTASASVRNAVADSAIQDFLNEIKAIRTNKVSADELQNVKNYLSGRFALSFENPSTVARFALNTAIENLPKDFYRTYLQRLNAVTLEQIQQAAQKYIPSNLVRIVVTGKAGDFSSKLARLGYPVKYFDQYAKPGAANNMEIKKVDASVNAAGIVKKYIDAIGGEAAVRAVNSLNIDFDASVQGMSLNGNLKRLNPDKELTTIAFNGNTVLKSVFNGENGYMEMQGQKKDMNAAEISSKKEMGGVFRQLNYNQQGFKLSVDGIESINGADAYKITVTSASGKKTTEYYDVKSGLLKKVESTEKTEAGETPTILEYRDYKKYGDILFPSAWLNLVGPQSIDITVKDIKINQAVVATDFN